MNDHLAGKWFIYPYNTEFIFSALHIKMAQLFQFSLQKGSAESV